jgi:hypothetical protein
VQEGLWLQGAPAVHNSLSLSVLSHTKTKGSQKEVAKDQQFEPNTASYQRKLVNLLLILLLKKSLPQKAGQHPATASFFFSHQPLTSFHTANERT